MKELFDKRNKENILKMIKSTKTLADSLNETQSPISSILNNSNNNTNSNITTTNTTSTTNNSMMIKLKINKKPNDLFLQQQTNQIKKRKHSLDSQNGNERTRSKSSRPYKTTSKQQQVVFTNTINNKTKTKETVKSVWADESEICKWTVPVLVETTTTTTQFNLDFNPALITYNRPNLPIRQNRIIYKPDFTQTLRQRLNKNNIIIDTNDDFLILREKPPIPPVSTVHRNNNHTHNPNTNKIITLPRKINYESYFGHTNYFS